MLVHPTGTPIAADLLRVRRLGRPAHGALPTVGQVLKRAVVYRSQTWTEQIYPVKLLVIGKSFVLAIL